MGCTLLLLLRCAQLARRLGGLPWRHSSRVTCGLPEPSCPAACVLVAAAWQLHSSPLCLAAPLQGIFSHPWFKEGLNPAALQFNDSIVRESLANQPSPEVLNEVGCERRVTAGWAGMRVHSVGCSKSHAWAMPH